MISTSLRVIAAAFEGLEGRDPAAVNSGELLAAIRRVVPNASMNDLLLAAEYLKRVASRLNGSAWLINPANRNCRQR
jgi:hypothetical protein